MSNRFLLRWKVYGHAKLNDWFGEREEHPFHPYSPGIRIPVTRGFWGRLVKPRQFATMGEVIRYHLAKENTPK